MRRRTGGPLQVEPRIKKKVKRTKTNVNPRRSKNKKTQPRGKDVSIRQSDAPWQIIYGRARVGGVWAYANAVVSALHMVIILAGCRLTSVDEYFCDDNRIVGGDTPDPRWATGAYKTDGTFTAAYNEKAFIAFMDGDPDQPVQPDLIVQSDSFPNSMKWTADHRLRGLAYVYNLLMFDNGAFPEGLPDLYYEVRGKPVYDPRTTLTEYSTNAALIVADYLTDTRYGCKIPWTSIDTDVLIASADVCDELVNRLQGTDEKRYEINFSFECDDPKYDVLEKMLTAMAGKITCIGGMYKIYAGYYRTPEVSLSRSDLRGNIRMQTRVPRRDNFNALKAKFVSPEKKWEVSDAPVVKNDFYRDQDNGERVYEDMTFPCTISSSCAQRLMKIELERIRQPITFSASFSLKAFLAEAGDVISYTDSRYGWTAKPFEIMELDFSLDTNGGDAPEIHIELQLRETASAVWDWNSGFETNVDLSPNTDLPNPFQTEIPLGLMLQSGTDQLYIRSDGTVFSRIKVSWNTLTNFFITSGGRIEIHYKQSALSDWSEATSVAGDTTFTHILDVADGEYYDVRIRSVNAIGSRSDWATVLNHLVIGKTAPPSDVEGFSAQVGDFGIRLLWTAASDRDVKLYEIRQADISLVWDYAVFVQKVQGTEITLDVRRSGSYYFAIKAVDTSENYSLNPTFLLVIIDGPSAVEVRHTITGPNVLLTWSESVARFAIDLYEIRYGDSYLGSRFVTLTKGSSFAYKVQWSGNRRFWVTAVDVAGNYGTPSFRDVQIYPPFAVNNLTAQVIDNNVLLRWEAALGGTMPISHYVVKKGATWEVAELIGTVGGTFTAIFEILAGTFAYWVAAVDSADNEGIPNSVGAEVDEPPDFKLITDIFLDPDLADTLDNIVIEVTPEPPDLLDEGLLPGEHHEGDFAGALFCLVYPSNYDAD